MRKHDSFPEPIRRRRRRFDDDEDEQPTRPHPSFDLAVLDEREGVEDDGPPEGDRWRVVWSSEDPKYGGAGTPDPETEEFNWRLSGHAAVALAPEPFDV